jgi:hypothetical protein
VSFDGPSIISGLNSSMMATLAQSATMGSKAPSCPAKQHTSATSSLKQTQDAKMTMPIKASAVLEASCQRMEAKAQKSLAKALNKFRRGDYFDALRHFNKVTHFNNLIYLIVREHIQHSATDALVETHQGAALQPFDRLLPLPMLLLPEAKSV